MDVPLNNSEDDTEQHQEETEVLYDATVVEQDSVLEDGTYEGEQEGTPDEKAVDYLQEDVSEDDNVEYVPVDVTSNIQEEHSDEAEMFEEHKDGEVVYQSEEENQHEEVLYNNQEEEVSYEGDENYANSEQFTELVTEQVTEEGGGMTYEEYAGDQQDLEEENNTAEEILQEVESENFHDASYEEIQYENDPEPDENFVEETDNKYEAEEVEQQEVVSQEDVLDTEKQEASYVESADTSADMTATEDVSLELADASGENVVAEEDDYEDVVEVEEDKVNEDGEDENVAQHESDSDNEHEEDVAEDVKLGDMSDYDVRDSDEEVEETFKKDDDKPSQEPVAKIFESDSEDEKEKEGVGDLIADIFGKSDDEDEEFTGFGEEESSSAKKNKSLSAVISESDDDDDDDDDVAVEKPTTSQRDDSSSDEGVRDGDKGSGGIVYDFDLMLQRKKEERKGRRRRDGGTFISDADDIINAMLTKMREAAVADREANKLKKPALNKLKMLPTVVRHLKKQDLKEAFVDMGMIAAIADWLTLLPDRSLPHISIRAELLHVLHDLPSVSPETLKSSGVGRAVMMLFKHPRETRKHKESAGRLVNKWSRPIFGLNENFKSMSRGEREQRDLDQMPQSKRRKLSSGRSEAEKSDEAAPEPGQLRPGERGFVMRARVPMPSNKDYVIRPKWNIEEQDEESTSSFKKRSKQKKDERLEKHLKTFADRRKNLKMQRAVGISLEGNKMPLT